MAASRSALDFPEPIIRTVSAKKLRQWCAPEVILAVTNLSDEQQLLPHVILQARQSGARVILAHLGTSHRVSSDRGKPSHDCRDSRAEEARAALDRMTRQLRWLGVRCEPELLQGNPELEIPHILRSCCVDRVLLGLRPRPDQSKSALPAAAELWLKAIDVPAFVIGEHVNPASFAGRMPRNITLALSLKSDCDVPLAFASRLAQELRAKLTVLHVFENKNNEIHLIERSANAVASSLPSQTLREAELFCPTEIIVREGDSAEQILKHCAAASQDLVLLCSPGDSETANSWRNGVTSRVLAEAQSPVLVFPKLLGEIGASHRSAPVEKLAAHGECPSDAFERRRACRPPIA